MNPATSAPPSAADVCIICALKEEGNAVQRMFERFAQCQFEQHNFQHNGRRYIYYATTLKNLQDAAISVALSWPSDAGELQIITLTSAMIWTFQPCFVAMSGICVGDRRKVRLGDLIVAEKSFKYDAGKIVLDEDGNQVLQNETDTCGPDPDILGWSKNFDDWSSLLKKLKRPKASKIEEDIPENANCYIKYMASSSTVRANDPFPNMPLPVRTAWAMEMESHAFYRTTASYRKVRSLVVKGVSDYAGPSKDDTFHTYAGEASALYLLGFIRTFVVDEFMPPRRREQPAENNKDIPPPSRMTAAIDPARWPDAFPPPFADAWGDDGYGLWAEFIVETPHGMATQRLRWIEPGTFRMGSPDKESERQKREGPQHPVTLTQGFWLADTACTQALWQAVMGDNPSHFKDDVQNPVEQVSWEDVQGFLRALEALLPGSEARLPTEAQWEYACRAGTTTPFSFGTQITPEQVNYDGNFPYAGGKKGEYRQRTLPVKSLPANAWGLYEMHGNVWEWCADHLRTYDTTPQQDPEGPADGPRRALRGGSWIYDARFARSAFRFGRGPGTRRDALGFRLCLRSRAR